MDFCANLPVWTSSEFEENCYFQYEGCEQVWSQINDCYNDECEVLDDTVKRMELLESHRKRQPCTRKLMYFSKRVPKISSDVSVMYRNSRYLDVK